MWCTRWFLPLLLLPLPTAPPYFLILFILSLTMHAKPCFYCIVLLTTLFVSSCYWQPFPIDSPLTVPWSENITTFAEALNASLPSNYTRPLPPVMRAVDRCWCEFSGSLFEPFNVSHWEYTSVQRLSHELERQHKLEFKAPQENHVKKIVNIDDIEEDADVNIPNISELPTPSPSPATKFWARFHLLSSTPSANSVPVATTSISSSNDHRKASTETEQSNHVHATLEPNGRLPLIRKEYDLRPYGLGMIIDFRWSR